jgi:hypothetical protein
MLRRDRTVAIFIVIIVLLMLLGCENEASSSRGPTSLKDDQAAAADRNDQHQESSDSVPTIYPTATARPLPTLIPPPSTSTPSPTVTPIDYQQIAVIVSYQIPGVGLDRRISANISSQVEVTDEKTGQVVEINNQPQVLIELQQALKEIELEPLAPDCPMCVRLEYELPILGESGSGWLQDRRLLASLENYTAALLGPHFPDNTLFGLRRSATLFHAAHTVVITENGQIWHWKANEAAVQTPSDFGEEILPLLQVREDIESDNLRDRYVINCPKGPGFEELYIADDKEDIFLRFTCPELTLPSSILPVYVALDGLANELVDLNQDEVPERIVPLPALLHFERDDGLNLTVFQDNTASLMAAENQIMTGTITSTIVLSLTNQLAEADLLQTGTADILQQTWPNSIFLRGEEDVYETGWLDAINPELADLVAWIDELIIQIQLGPDEDLENTEDVQSQTPSPTDEPQP